MTTFPTSPRPYCTRLPCQHALQHAAGIPAAKAAPMPACSLQLKLPPPSKPEHTGSHSLNSTHTTHTAPQSPVLAGFAIALPCLATHPNCNQCAPRPPHTPVDTRGSQS